MAFHGLPWPSMTFHGLPWPSMTFHGLPWTFHATRLLSTVCSVSAAAVHSSAPPAHSSDRHYCSHSSSRLLLLPPTPLAGTTAPAHSSGRHYCSQESHHCSSLLITAHHCSSLLLWQALLLPGVEHSRASTARQLRDPAGLFGEGGCQARADHRGAHCAASRTQGLANYLLITC